MSTNIKFPQGPIVDPSGYVTLEWQQWLQNPQVITFTLGTALPVGSGGTGITTTPANGQILIGNASGYTLNNLTGTSNQVVITNGSGTITLSLPQDIAAASSPTFAAVNKVSITAPASNATLTIANGKTLTASNTLTLSGTDGSTLNVGTGGTLASMAQQASNNVTISGGTINGAVIGGTSAAAVTATNLTINTNANYAALTASTALALDASKNAVSVTNTGSGSNVLATSPTLVTPTLGAASATSINFGQTSLNYYQEGTWTPTDASGASLSFSLATGSYERLGRMVASRFVVTYPATASGSQAIIDGRPFTSNTTSNTRQGFISYRDNSSLIALDPQANSTQIYMRNGTGTALTNATLSGSTFFGTALYYV